MTAPEPTAEAVAQVVREAAAKLAENKDSGLPNFIAGPIRSGQMDWHPLVQALQAERDKERDAIVAWLRKQEGEYSAGYQRALIAANHHRTNG